ncbi:hypothetical protein P280DRAFT_535723 [Massarina eburnea CBS 473.64]|uniref:Uncharacterized protein n=1 Tax=Massarina eburnea CBS 473.64 TaxID=1395130 RepID=A0A6A6SFI9_9PLEO|nr:hypothetical protein P280DRAFT_535723 [Massarina eburnea CBS 473.64]
MDHQRRCKSEGKSSSTKMYQPSTTDQQRRCKSEGKSSSTKMYQPSTIDDRRCKTEGKSSSATTMTPLLAMEDDRLEMTAAHKVFGVAELLENILLNLDATDILYNAPRVSRFWKECIDGSDALDKNCLFVPDIEPDKDKCDTLLFPDFPKYEDQFTKLKEYLISEGTWMHGLSEAKSGRSYQDSYDDTSKFWLIAHHFDTMNDSDTRMPLTLLDTSLLNPVLRNHFTPQRGCYWSGYEDHIFLRIPSRLLSLKLQEPLRSIETVTSVPGGLKNAVATRPAATKLVVCFKDNSSVCRWYSFERDQGITVDDVMRGVTYFIEEYGDHAVYRQNFWNKIGYPHTSREYQDDRPSGRTKRRRLV